jgi:uncharacterized membrane protein
MKALKEFWHYIYSIFLNGLFALLPITLTIVLFHFSFILIKGWLEPIVRFLPCWMVKIPHSEILVVVFFILLVGAILRSFVIYSVLHYFETIVSSLPFVKPVYHSVKQLVSAFGGKKDHSFKQVVLVSFPYKGSYSIGFLTGQVPPELAPSHHATYYSIFVPATPNPTSGFFIIVTSEDYIATDLTRQEAMTLILSGGIILPDRYKSG